MIAFKVLFWKKVADKKAVFYSKLKFKTVSAYRNGVKMIAK